MNDAKVWSQVLAVKRAKEEGIVLSPAFFETIADYDPSSGKKYVSWLIQRYGDGGIHRFEDLSLARVLLEKYDALKNKSRNPDKTKNVLSDAEKDINRINTLGDLQDLIEARSGMSLTSRREDRKSVEEAFYHTGQATLFYNDDEVKIVIPKTVEASCYFGKNTRWCTAATVSKNYFNEYKGNLYIVLIKKSNKRYQFHFHSEQYMNERNEHINPRKLADLYPVLWSAFRKTSIEARNLVFVRDPTLEDQVSAIARDSSQFRYINNPSEELKSKVVLENPGSIRGIVDPSESLQLIAVSRLGGSIIHIHQPSLAVQLAAVNQDGRALSYIRQPVADAVQIAAVKQDFLIVRQLSSRFSNAALLAAASKYGCLKVATLYMHGLFGSADSGAILIWSQALEFWIRIQARRISAFVRFIVLGRPISQP